MGLLQVALLGERLNNPWAPNRSTRLTRGLWYRLGTVHDLETKVDMSSRSFQISVWTAHHAQLAIIFFWASVPLLQLGWQGDYEAWIQNPTVIPIAHAIRDPHFSASAVSAFSASITCTTGVYEWYYTIGLRTSAQLITAASFLVILGGLCLTAGVIHGASRRTFHFPGQRVLSALDSNVNHHLTGLLGVGSIAWAGHLVHVALPASRGQSVTWAQLPVTLPSPEGLRAFANLDWYQYTKNSDGLSHVFGQADAAAGTSILTFIGTRMPSSDSLYLSDVAHHHLALGILCILLGSIVRTIDLSNDVSGLHWSLALSLAALGTASSFAATNIDAFTVYAFLSNDFTALSAIYTHHQYIAGFFLLGAFAHGAIYLIRDASNAGPATDNVRTIFVRGLIRYRAAIISHLSAITLFLGFHTLGLYVHNDVMQGLGTPELEISLSPVFGQWLQVAHGRQAGSPLGCGDVLVHHAIALGLHVTTLILLKAALNGRSSKLMPDKSTFGYGFPCDGPGRGGTCDISAWDGFYLAAFWMLNTIGWITFYWHWKHIALKTDNLALWSESSTYLMGWLRDYLWFNSAQLINGYSPLGVTKNAVWDWMFLFGHLIWATGFMFLISWRGYWQELIESIVWAHEQTPIANTIVWVDKPVALSIVQARFVGLAHFAIGYVLTYGPFVMASSSSLG